MDSKNVEKGQVELVLEKRMLEHLCLWDPNYPECPERLSSIIDRYSHKIKFTTKKTK